MDGVGLGEDDPEKNPFSTAHMPNLQTLLGGRRLLFDALEPGAARQDSTPGRLVAQSATLLSLDACLGVAGLPQSATGQATLLTGRNVPAILGYHYGPKPNQAIAEILREDNLFHRFGKLGHAATLLNAYPPSYFASVASGRRLFSAIPLAVTSAALPLRTAQDLQAGQAISADLTGRGWREQLHLTETPLISAYQAGEGMARLALEQDFAFFEFWLSDYAGHNQNMPAALALLETLDQALAGLLAAWEQEHGLILITSDHGNLEDLSTRRHTTNPVPALIIGRAELRAQFIQHLFDISGIVPAILQFYQ